MKKILLLLIVLSLLLCACSGRRAEREELAASEALSSSAEEPLTQSSLPAVPQPDADGGDSSAAPEAGEGFEDETAHGARTPQLIGHTLCSAENPVYIRYRTMMDIGMGEETVTVTLAARGSDHYRELKSETVHVSTLQLAERIYSIQHDAQLIVEVEGSPASSGFSVNTVPGIYDNVSVEMGLETIDGETYDCETIGSNTYYYEPGTNHWKLLRSDDSLMEILEYGSNADESLFSLPEGYQSH